MKGLAVITSIMRLKGFNFSCLLLILTLLSSCTEQTIETKAEAPLSASKLKAYINEASQFCKTKNLNDDFFILIDLGIHSGKKRFFSWDFRKKTFTDSFLVSHGCCSNAWGKTFSKAKAGVSNQDGSHCSSVGRYRIGKRGFSNWGIKVKYFMHGLDSTNSNAMKRDIVFHSWEAVSDDEVYPAGTPEGWGCPAVSNSAMRLIDERLKKSKKNVLMWIIQ